MIDALGQGKGRFYGVGITSRKPGYYLSYALRRGQPRGENECKSCDCLLHWVLQSNGITPWKLSHAYVAVAPGNYHSRP